MIEAEMHVDSDAATEATGPRGRTRTCVGCCERVDLADPSQADVVRLVLGPGGEIAVDARGHGGSGRGAHVHARRACVDRAARGGLLRATKGAARFVEGAEPGEADKPEALSTDSLARAIQRSMDRRVEGLLTAAVRSRQLACGGDAVASSRRGDAKLVVVACDSAETADLLEVRRAVAEGRAVAWGTRERLGAIIAPPAVRGRLATPVTQLSPAEPGRVGETAHPTGAPASEPRGSNGVGVIAIASRSIAEALRTAVQAASAVTSLEVATRGAKPPNPRQLQAGSHARPGKHRGQSGPVGPGGARRGRDRRDG